MALPIYDITCFKGLIVVGFHYCPFTVRACKQLAEQRLPFHYIEAGNNRHCYYTNVLAEQLLKPYKHETNEAFQRREKPHRTMPIVLENMELIGGADQVQDLLFSRPEELEALRARIQGLQRPIVFLPPGDPSASVPTDVLRRIQELVSDSSESSFRFVV